VGDKEGVSQFYTNSEGGGKIRHRGTPEKKQPPAGLLPLGCLEWLVRTKKEATAGGLLERSVCDYEVYQENTTTWARIFSKKRVGRLGPGDKGGSEVPRFASLIWERPKRRAHRGDKIQEKAEN